VQPFRFQLSTRIFFGRGVSSTAAEVLTELNGTHPLIVTDTVLLKAGVVNTTLQSIQSGNLGKPLVFDAVRSESDLPTVNQAVELARRNSCNCLVAVGGGSVIDTAKGINIALSLGGTLKDHQGLNNLPHKLSPLIAIPTTAGTGSEVSYFASVKDIETQTKLVFGSAYLAPDIALLDPDLLVGLPPALTAATGADALTHCIESYVAQDSTSPFTTMHCEAALKLLFMFLPAAVANGKDMEAREATLLASTMAGVAFTNTGVGVVHALSHAVSGRFGSHHGATNAVFLVPGMKFNFDTCKHQYARLARAIGVSRAAEDDTAANELLDAVATLLKTLKLPASLKDIVEVKISNQDLEFLAEAAALDPATMFNPRECNPQDLRSIYERCM
jgi:alcohol dehydrogenase